MDIRIAIDNAAKGKLLPIYLLGGSEQLLIQRCCDAVRVATVGSGTRGLSEDVYDAKQTSAAAILTACRTLPMMSRRRLVLVRGAEDMRKADQEALLPYLDAPEATTVLVLAAPGFDKRFKLCLTAMEKGYFFEAAPPTEAELAPWIEREAKTRGVTFEAGAAESLAMAIGPDLALLVDAMERLSLYTNGAPIQTSTIDHVITAVREVPAWDLAEAIGQRNVSACLTILARLLSQDQAPLAMLGLIAWQIRMIARARAHLDARAPGNLASVLRMRPSAADSVAQQARKWTPAHLSRALRILSTTDQALKGAKRGEARVIEECIMALCGAAGMGELAIR
jgi:DNA polymerase-3 subunit delta